MPNRDELQRRLLATFREEAAEHVQVLDQELLAMSSSARSTNSRERLDTVFRVMHTLKGAARSVRFSEIEEICQQNEALLRDITRGETDLTDAGLALLKRSTERLQELIYAEQLKSSTALPDPAGDKVGFNGKATEQRSDDTAVADGYDLPDAYISRSREPANDFTAKPKNEMTPSAPLGSIRVDIGRLDRLILVAEELLLPSLVMTERSRAAKVLSEDVRILRSNVRSRNGTKSTGSDRNDRATVLETLKEIETKSRKLALALADDQRILRTAVSELFQETRQARMVPAATMLAAFPAMVRDLCRSTGKQAKWRLNESSVELDRGVIEVVKDPLVHLVRNAVDHGIELPDEREAAGKPRRGKISISISSIEGGRVAIKIRDDGRGMNVTALRDAAVRSRSATAAQVQSLSDEDVIDLAFRPGVSTRAVITSISGLGLGLSIVREQMERIDGRVIVSSTPGQGTSILLDLPQTIASYRGLLVAAGSTKLLWPGESVERAIGISKATAAAAAQSGLISHSGETLPFGRLTSMMGIQSPGPASEGRRLLPCIIVSSGPRRAAFMVDDVLGETDVLVKDLPSPLRRVRNVSSAGLLASGEMALVLRPADLLSSVHNRQDDAVESGKGDDNRRIRILVVDDSITTRTMERNLFEAAGYSVSVAADGIDAWSALQTESIDIIVSDVDMPRMNGFELTSKIRGDTRLADLPVVLVTALESRDDKERGVRIGANAYVLKSSFDQSNLLAIVGRLI